MSKKSRSVRRGQQTNHCDSSAPAYSSQDNLINMTMSLPEGIGELEEADIRLLAEAALGFLSATLTKSVAARQAPSYDSETKIYHFSGEEFQENDIIWLPLLPTSPSDEENRVYESANVDMMSFSPHAFNAKHVPHKLGRLILQARYLAFSREEIGSLLICHSGEFWLPCTEFVNPYTFEREYLMSIYNAELCLPTHRHFYAAIDAGIGNLDFVTDIRYVQGLEIDWEKRFQDEVRLVRSRVPDYDPFVDPYDAGNIIEPYYYNNNNDDDS